VKLAGTLIAGPYCGEFGWEVGCWNPRIRRIARNFARTIVLTRASSAPLYEFASRVVPIEVEPDTSDFVHGELAAPAPEVEGDVRVLPTPELVRMELAQMRFSPSELERDVAKTWRLFGRWRRPTPTDVCLALRPPKLHRGQLLEHKAYPEALGIELAQRILGLGLRVACIGGPENRWVPGTVDMRGAPLGDQLDALANALCTVGPSSGTLHLAQLCGCAVVTWYDAPPVAVESSRARYTRAWNPWASPLRYLEPRPAPEHVAAAVAELAELVRRQRLVL
jgi:hypothetical protein